MLQSSTKMKKLILIFLVLVTTHLQAQNIATESKEVAFKIYYTYNLHDTIIALIDGGSNSGIEKNMVGRCRSVFDGSTGRKGFDELGFIKIIYLRKDTSAAIITLNNKFSSKDSVKVGDLITVNITLPKKEYHSLFYELALLNIQFKDIYGKKYVTPNYIYKNDSKQLEDSITQLIVNDTKEVYTTVKNIIDSSNKFASIKSTLNSGRFKGKSTIDVMRDVTANDVKHFLQFVNAYPGKYIGFTWKSSETFATWVMNKGLTSSYELKEELTSLQKNSPAFKKYIIDNKIPISNEKIISTLSNEALTAIGIGDYNKAKNILDFAFDIANIINDTSGKAELLVSRAEWYQYQEKYTEAIPFCNQAIALAFSSKNYSDEMHAYFKKVFCLYKIGKYGDAKTVISEAQKRIDQIKENISIESYRYHLRKRYDYAGWVNYEAGNYKEALVNFLEAINISKSINNYQSKNDLALSYEYVGLTYNKQGMYNSTLPYFDSAIVIYKNFGKIKSQAIITNRIAYSNFKMGNYKKSVEIYEKTIPILLKENDYENVSYAKSMLAQSFWNLGKHADAIASHQQAIEYAKTANLNYRQAFSWEKLGDLYKLTGEKTKALAAYDSCVNYYAIIKDSSSIINNINNVGEVYKNDKNYEKAIEYYERALKFARGLSAKKEQVTAIYNIADAAFYYDTTKSRIYYSQCRELCKTTGDVVKEYYSTANLGLLQARNLRIKEADQLFREALLLAEKTKNPEDLAWIYARIATSAMQQLEFDDAEKYYFKSLKIYDSTNNKTEYAKGLPNLGWLNISKGKFDVAEKYFTSTVALADSISNKLLKGDALNGLSYLYELQGDFKNGFAANDSAMDLYKNTGSNVSLANAFISRGILFSAISQFAKSVEAYTTADSIFTAEKMELSRSTTINNIANVYYLQADYEKSLATFKKAEEKLIPDLQDEIYIIVKENIAECEFYLKNFDKAEKSLLELLPLSQSKQLNRLTVSIEIVLGKLYYGKQQYTNAEKYLSLAKETSLKSREVEHIVESSMYAGKTALALNKKLDAYANLLTASLISTKYNLSKFNWETQYEMGIYHYQNNNADSAIKYLKNAVDLVEKNISNLYGGEEAKKKYSSDEKKVDLYNKLVATLATANKTEDALFYVDKTNNQAIKEKIGNAGLETNDKEKASELKKASELLQKNNAVAQAIAKEKAKPESEQNIQLIASLESVKNITETDYTNFIEQLQRKYPDLQSYFSNTNPKDFKNYIEDIPDSTIVVLYVVNDNQLLIFTVTNKETAIKVVELKQDLNKQAAKFLSILRNPNNATGTQEVKLRSTIKPVDDIRGDFKTISTDLYNLLITPIAEQLKDKKNLCIITNGKLGSIPFQCLGVKDNSNSFHFLVEDYAIFYTTKIDIFRKNFKNRKMESSLALFGNPDKSLPGATEEAKNIAQIVPTATVFIEEKATEGKAKECLQNYNYVHFATHGILDYTNFEDSYLVFAKDDGLNDDGKLTIKEINGLTKQTNSMVILSACETAVSKEEVKGWYISPANAFLTNRVDAVIATLWKVPDETTNLLLTYFYSNITQKGMTKVEALRNAQARVSENPKFNHPFYWSAFVLIGDWR